MLARMQPGSDCVASWRQQFDDTGYANPGKVWHYNPVTKVWRPSASGMGNWASFGVATEYDPLSGKIILMDRYGFASYDPRTEVSRQEQSYSSGELSYGQNLIYYPPNQKMYYVMNNGEVYEVTLDRSNLSRTSIVKMTGITGTPPPGSLPNISLSDEGETGWAYDSTNQIIGGGVRNGIFYAFDPVAKTWTAKTMNISASGGIGAGLISASHTLDYDPVNNAFIYITLGNNTNANYERYTWAYKYGNGDISPTPSWVNTLTPVSSGGTWTQLPNTSYYNWVLSGGIANPAPGFLGSNWIGSSFSTYG